MNNSSIVALVTGANRGIGRAFVQHLARAGAKRIYAAARDVASLEPMLRDLPNTVIPLRLDVTDVTSIVDASAVAGDINVLVNNAGVVSGLGGITAQNDLEGARREMDVNYFGLLETSRIFAPILVKNAPAAIVNVLSILGVIGPPRLATYNASKAASLAATRALRAELQPRNVAVIAVMPGYVDTDMTRGVTVPKIEASDVVREALSAIDQGVEDVYPGDLAQNLVTAFFNDHKAVEKEFSGVAV